MQRNHAVTVSRFRLTTDVLRPMGLLLAIIAYVFYAAFAGRFLWHLLLWLQASRQVSAGPAPALRAAPAVVAVLDLVLLRRLFSQNKLLWIGSWTFHVSFFLVVLRHLRYFLDPVPGCIIDLQPFGLVAGYVLPFSLLLILVRRAVPGRNRYVSASNYYLLCSGLAISITGLAMRVFFHPDLAAVKGFILGILTFRPEPLPQGFLFILHFVLAVLLLPLLPIHMIAAPLVSLDARQREEELLTVLHD